jgi:dihydroorotate dehydrogenase (NAD+) catalytic subunit
MLNSVGLANPGLAHVRDHELPWLARRLAAARIVVNVVGFTVEEYGAVVSGLEHAEGIAAFELNLSCPNTAAGGLEFGADAAAVRAIVGQCRRVTKKPLLAKLSPALPDMGAMAVAAGDAGIDGITVVNTLPGCVYDASGRMRLGNGHGGISGPALLPAGILAVRRVIERTGLPVIGVGGIRSGADALQYFAAGASLVAVGTGGLADPRLPERVIRELRDTDG